MQPPMLPPDVLHFHYHGDSLYCEGLPLHTLAATYGTPLYVYSKQALLDQVGALKSALGNGHACYAVKANQNANLLRLFATQGLGADVTSGGELYLALQAGVAPANIIYSGVGKTDAELRFAIESNIRAIHVESAPELAVIERLANEFKTTVNIGVRVNPDIDVPTHPYISTGAKVHKFGVPPAQAVQLLAHAAQSPSLNPVAIACHIGSQILALPPFQAAADFLVELAVELRSSGIQLDYIDMGGGIGISYTGSDPIGIADWVNTVRAPVEAAGFNLAIEPGRALVGAAGALLTTVTFVKDNGYKQFAITDAGMNDLLRPTLYQAQHPILPLALDNATPQTYDVVGPICESGDFLAKALALPTLQRGSQLAVLQAGAYGFAMASNYNGRLRAAEVLVDGETATLIRERETYADLLP